MDDSPSSVTYPKPKTIREKYKDLSFFEFWSLIFSLSTVVISILGFWYVIKGLDSSDKTYRTSTYLLTYGWSIDLDKSFIEHPELRKYFHDGVSITDTDKTNHNNMTYNKVAATAELMLDNWDAILNNKNYFKTHSVDETSWKDFIITSFMKGPIIDVVFKENPCNWPNVKSVVDVAKKLKLNDTTTCK